eukprot:UN18152
MSQVEKLCPNMKHKIVNLFQEQLGCTDLTNDNLVIMVKTDSELYKSRFSLPTYEEVEGFETEEINADTSKNKTYGEIDSEMSKQRIITDTDTKSEVEIGIESQKN